LSDIAFITMNGVHHELQNGIENRTSVFRVKVLDKVRGVFNVSKKSGNAFPLAVRRASGLHRLPLGQDPLGEMAWRIGYWLGV
jgi:hypothetical protein